MRKLMIFLAAALFVLNATNLVIANSVFDAETLWQIKRTGNPVVSPEGTKSVFTITEYNIDENNSQTNIYLLDHSSAEYRQLTFSGSDNSPVWSPDGEKIAFVSGRKDGRQVYVLDLKRGGEAQKITKLPVGTFAPKWFPCGTQIAFGANILPDYNGDWDKLEEMIDKKNNCKVTAKVTENTMYRFWDRWLTDGFYPRLFKVNLNENNKVTDLMPETANFFNLMGGVSYDISPDGKTIAVSMNSTKPPYDRTNNAIFILQTDGSGKMENITSDNKAGDYDPVFSSCGNYIAYGKQNIHHFYADKVVLTVYDVNNKRKVELTNNIDLSAQQWFWSEDNDKLFFLAEDRAKKSIFSISLNGSDFTEVLRKETINGAAKAANNTLVFNNQSLSSPNDIFELNLRTSNTKNLTNLNKDLLADIKWGKVEDITYKGANDADVQMFIIFPGDYDPNKKYPLVVLIHGGPHGIFGDQFHYRWNAQLYAQQGYIVAMPNFHGSTSFGQDFAISIHGNHADKPFRDIMKATDYMIERGLVDPDRMAAAGGSYGGYMVSWIAGHTDRYACLINHAGVYDLHLQFASDYSGNRGYQYGGTPYDNFDQLNKNNPSQFAENFKSPMLVIHGELDYRVPVAHGFLVYGIYKSMGLDARLLYYPDENHWILTPQNSIFWYGEFLGWLDRYLN